MRDFVPRTVVRSTAGDFEIRGVPPGSYLIIASEDSLQGRVPLELGNADMEGIRVALASGSEVKGRITTAGEKRSSLAGSQIFLTADGQRGDMVSVESDGTFTSSNLPADRYRALFSTLPPDFYIKSMRSGEMDVLNDGLKVPGTGVTPLEIALASDGGRVDGAILDQDERPVEGATVVLVPTASLRGRFDLFKTVATNQYGQYEMKAIPPGEYTLFPWDDVEPGEWHDPAFLTTHEQRGEPVSIEANWHVTAKLHVISLR